jgi:putative ABC transport system permease protein
MKTQLKLALRVLTRRKFFTAVSLFGIGFTLLVLMLATALFDHVFAGHAPETRFDRTLGVYRMELRGPSFRNLSMPAYPFLDQQVRTLPGVERVAVFRMHRQLTGFHDGRRIDAYVKRTDGEFWNILDFRFIEGAPYTQADDDAGRFVAVINESTRGRFFGDAPAVGRSIAVDGQTFRVVGVVEDVPMTRQVPFADVWAPISTSRSTEYRFEQGTDDFMAIVLAKSESDFPRLKRELQRRLEANPPPDPKQFTKRISALETPFEAIASKLPTHLLAEAMGVRPATLLRTILALLAALFMLLPAMNLVNLNLSRMFERASEIGVRKAYGASRLRLVGQFVLENVVLTFLGAVLGFVLSAVFLHFLNESGIVPYSRFALNLRIFGWGVVIAFAFGVVSGVFPAWRMSRLHPVLALKGVTR